MSAFEKYFPWGMLGIGALYLVYFFVPRDDEAGKVHFNAFAHLPVIDQGRLRPMDTTARVELLAMTGGRQTWTDSEGNLRPAIHWLLEIMSGRFDYEKTVAAGLRESAILLNDPDLPEDLRSADDALHSMVEILSAREDAPDPLLIMDIGDQLAKTRARLFDPIEMKSPDARTPQEHAMLRLGELLAERFATVHQQGLVSTAAAAYQVIRIENDEVLSLLGLEPRPRFRYALNEFAKRLPEFYRVAAAAQDVPEKEQSLYHVKVLEVARRLRSYESLVIGKTPLAIPPFRSKDNWTTLQAVRSLSLDDPLSQDYVAMLAAYHDGNVEEFNEALVKYRATIERHAAGLEGRVNLETFFNTANPFFHAQHLYMLVFLFGCLSWLGWSEPFRKAGLYLAVMTLAVHTLALFGRMYIMDRPFVFVTNLYSSAIFIGWGAVLTGVILDYIYRNGIGVVAAGAVGYSTLIVASYLSLSGDTLGSLQAVLDTNFWLATHVTTVTFGYTACFLAGAIGATYILLGVFTRYMTPERSQTVGKMLYGVVCFGMFLSFLGTVLGGIWADQSWGRFWGWDPKENGALLIVLWCALILHARWGGMIKLRGMAMLAVGANIVTAWSWFGTNMLGVGLHSYGFMEGAIFWMLFFVGTQLALIFLGAIPQDMWRSYGKPRSPRGIGAAPQNV